MTSSSYLHGYSSEEQARLVDQARYWRSVIVKDLDYAAGDRVLEMGCGVGAVLGVLLQEYPGIRIAGIDLEEKQVEAARRHLAELGSPDADLRVGSALESPWPEGTFDHVVMMWILEHLEDPGAVLREAHRVLKSGADVVLHETDYTSFRVHPESPDFDALVQAQYDYFGKHGQPYVGRVLGPLLRAAGFVGIRNEIAGVHYFQGADDGGEALARHVEYNATFLEMSIELMARDLGRDLGSLKRGCEHLRSVARHPEGAITQLLFRARARKP